MIYDVRCSSLEEQLRGLSVTKVQHSVADPGSGAFLPPGSGIWDEIFPDLGSWIRLLFLVKFSYIIFRIIAMLS
jgi:hypothetical protein